MTNMPFDPSKRGPVSIPRRDPCVLQIIYDPNTGVCQVQSSGFRDCVEELGTFAWAKAMRERVFTDAAGIGQNKIAIAPSGAIPPRA